MSAEISAEQTPSAKRRKLDSGIVQDPELWMSDGNIVVTAVETTEKESITHAFRVHKSVLAKHSPVFGDLFTLPQAAETEQYEGIPVVKLPDHYRDIRGLLRLFYNPGCVELL